MYFSDRLKVLENKLKNLEGTESTKNVPHLAVTNVKQTVQPI